MKDDKLVDKWKVNESKLLLTINGLALEQICV